MLWPASFQFCNLWGAESTTIGHFVFSELYLIGYFSAESRNLNNAGDSWSHFMICQSFQRWKLAVQTLLGSSFRIWKFCTQGMIYPQKSILKYIMICSAEVRSLVDKSISKQKIHWRGSYLRNFEAESRNLNNVWDSWSHFSICQSFQCWKLAGHNTNPLLSDSVKERLSYDSAKCSAGAWFRGNYRSFVRGLLENCYNFFSVVAFEALIA